MNKFATGNMVNLIATQHVFGFSRKTEILLDGWGLPNLRIRRITRAIKKAASQKKVVHLWAHPGEFRTEGDFSKLRYIFESVAEEVAAGRMKTISMIDMARMVCKLMEDNIRVLVATNTYPSVARPGDTPSIKDQVEDLKNLGVSG